MSNKPDAIVKEETAREAVDRLVGGITSDARAAGKLPDVRAAEAFVRPIVEETVKRHEEQFRNGKPERAKPEPPPEPEAKPGTVSRSLGTFDWDPNTNDIKAVGAVHPKLAKKMESPILTAWEAREQLQLRKRLERINGDPDWRQRWINAYFQGCFDESKRLMEGGKYTVAEVESLTGGCEQEIRSAGTDAAMKVVEASNIVFGDWRWA